MIKKICFLLVVFSFMAGVCVADDPTVVAQLTWQETWSYHIVTTPKFQDLEKVRQLLNRYGRKGWELVTIKSGAYATDVYYFKRMR